MSFLAKNSFAEEGLLAFTDVLVSEKYLCLAANSSVLKRCMKLEHNP